MIEQYFQSILDLLASLPFVSASDINLEKRGELVGFVRGRVEFQDGSSLLFFRELIDMRLPLQKVMYAYHYQKADGVLVFAMTIPHTMNLSLHSHTISICRPEAWKRLTCLRWSRFYVRSKRLFSILQNRSRSCGFP